MIKTLVSSKTDSIANRIRATEERALVLHSPRFYREKKTVVKLLSGNALMGTLKAKTRQEAERITRSREVNLTIGWDHNRNEQIEANFVY